jgi:hypothetical protein
MRFLFAVLVFHEVCAGLSLGTGAAVLRRLADGVLGGEDFFAFVAEGSHGIEEDGGGAHGDLGGDLQAVEKESGAARIEARGGQLAEDLGERNLDGAAVFKRRQLEVVPDAFGSGGAVEVGVEVAVGHFAQGRRVAPDSAGHDVTAFVVHDSSAFPQGLKPALILRRCGTTEVVPFQSRGGGTPLPVFCKEVP